MINGREYLLEYALPLDYAFIRAVRGDTFGNLQFHRAQRNFCPVMATAARTTIAEVDEDILPAGAIDMSSNTKQEGFRGSDNAPRRRQPLIRTDCR